MNSDEKICPRCAETIKSAAVVCRFCGHEFAASAVNGPAATASPDTSTCKKCGKIYAAKFKSCPHCKSSAGKGCLVGIGIIVGIAAVGSLFSNDKSKSSSSSTGNTASSEASCSSDWTKCKDNSDLVEHYSRWVNIQVACKMEANDRAKYGNPDWPWIPFGSYLKGDAYITSGVAVAIEKDAQFQNGFGAMVHSTVVCNYDLRTQKVTSVDIEAH